VIVRMMRSASSNARRFVDTLRMNPPGPAVGWFF
jgi:hypothetical protein